MFFGLLFLNFLVLLLFIYISFPFCKFFSKSLCKNSLLFLANIILQRIPNFIIALWRMYRNIQRWLFDHNRSIFRTYNFILVYVHYTHILLLWYFIFFKTLQRYTTHHAKILSFSHDGLFIKSQLNLELFKVKV